MAKKKDNTLLWVAGLGIAGYIYWQYKNTTPPVNSTVPNASSGTLLLPASTATTSNQPSIPVNSLPLSTAPPSSAPSAVVVNTTNLTPAILQMQGNIPVLAPGQTLALNNNGTPVVDRSGNPMVFQKQMDTPTYNMEQNGDYPGANLMAGCYPFAKNRGDGL